MGYSIIIRTKNESRWIGHSIQSLLDNITNPEIILVDNKSDDSTLEIVKLFAEDPLLNKKDNSRYANIKIENTGAGESWRFGTFQVDLQPDGRRG